ncbi:RLF2 Chromatin assembly factor 1 subunit p90 [Candida maltosa Xu316]
MTDTKRKVGVSDSEKENITPPSKKIKTDMKITKKEQLKLERERKREEDKLKKEQEKLERKKKLEDEREMKRLQLEKEKEMKRKKQEEEKRERDRKKEEERIQKEKDKQEREQARLEKKKKLEDEKKAKELERKRLEEEKKKAEEAKERSQKKISSFFQVTQKSKTKKAVVESAKNPGEPVTKSAYEKEFLPFFVKDNVKLIEPWKKDISNSKKTLDALFDSKDPQPSSFKNYLSSFNNPQISKSSITPEEIINALNSPSTTEQMVYKMIESLPPIKYISFYENSKPPYVGTWCSINHQKLQESIIQNPLNTDLTGLDYSYDSDLEWNKEDEEGEDLENDDDEEEEEDTVMEDEDDEEFVENDPQSGKKKFITLTVVNKWNNEENAQLFNSFTTVKLVDIEEPIDPFFNYWGDPGLTTSTGETPTTTTNETATTTTTVTPTGTTSTPNILIAQKKTIKDTEVLSKLIKFIEANDDFSIGTLVELSNKEFRGFTKALLKNTIQEIASYNKRTTKWEVKTEMKEKYLVSV